MGPLNPKSWFYKMSVMSVFLYVTTKPILSNLQQSCIFGYRTRTSNNCEIRFNQPQFWLKEVQQSVLQLLLKCLQRF